MFFGHFHIYVKSFNARKCKTEHLYDSRQNSIICGITEFLQTTSDCFLLQPLAAGVLVNILLITVYYSLFDVGEL